MRGEKWLVVGRVDDGTDTRQALHWQPNLQEESVIKDYLFRSFIYFVNVSEYLKWDADDKFHLWRYDLGTYIRYYYTIATASFLNFHLFCLAYIFYSNHHIVYISSYHPFRHGRSWDIYLIRRSNLRLHILYLWGHSETVRSTKAIPKKLPEINHEVKNYHIILNSQNVYIYLRFTITILQEERSATMSSKPMVGLQPRKMKMVMSLQNDASRTQDE